MTEAILVGILSAFSALAGIAITQFYEFKRRVAEENRWYAEFFLSRKVDALQHLYTAFTECHHVLTFYGNVPPKTALEYREQVMKRVETYLRAMSAASLYLDDEAADVFSKVLGAFRQASTAISLSLPDEELSVHKDSYADEVRNVNWEVLGKTSKNAANCLRKMLNPHVLQTIDTKMLRSQFKNLGSS